MLSRSIKRVVALLAVVSVIIAVSAEGAFAGLSTDALGIAAEAKITH